MTSPARRWALKEAALRLGIIGLVQFVPLFLLTLVTGWTADRLDRRWIARGVGRARARLRGRARLARLDPRHDAVFALRRRRAARRRAAHSPVLRSGRSRRTSFRARSCRERSHLSSIAWQSGAILGPALGGYLYAYAPYAPYAASAMLFAVAFVCLVAIGPVPADRIAARPEPVGANGRGAALRPPQPARARRDQPRSVRGAARRSDGDAARCSRATCSTPGRRASAISAPRPRSARHSPPPSSRSRPLKHNVGIKMLVAVGVFGARDDRLRAVAVDAAVARLPRVARRCRHVLGLRPPVADPALHAGRDARPGRRGLVTVHLGLERARRGRIGLPRRADRPDPGSDRRRRRRDRRGPSVVLVVPRAAPCKKLRRTRFAPRHTRGARWA